MLQNGWGGGKSGFTPTKKKGGGRTSFSHAGGGGTKRFKVVLTQKLEVLAILIGGAKGFHPFVAPPPPPHN